MFSFLYKNRIPKISPKLHDYCIKSTNDSIRKISENYNEERKIKKIVLPSNTSISIPFDPNSNIDIFISLHRQFYIIFIKLLNKIVFF
jgi:hypothetical protein